MKRKIDQIESNDVMITQKNHSNIETFQRFSQNIDLQECFKLEMIDGKIYNENKDRVLYLIINKNSKINKKLDQILKYLNGGDEDDDNKIKNKEIIFIANDGECIQKMISIIEIFKQKIIQLQDIKEKDKDLFENKSIAKVKEYEKIIISGEVLNNDKIKMNYTQLNFIDFTLIEKVINRNITKRKNKKKNLQNKETNGLYEKSIIEEILKVEKLTKIPVMYVYMNLHGENELPIKNFNKYKNLVAQGWSIQQS
ncbi:hypothetical protein C6P40_002275 [Pichia californica]|uniref:DNA/RNA-binding protein Alba-like domain-containing protein n=1 Tax=Pichia californica TaxID=460514 RepID=A0A9P6WIB2_9ASCO|nr:hypothetical protein C6P42_000853 [[Candida] californica]KAG0687492.1 hypothetical protein C6P40_002275 [[Candida] californica]